MAALELPPPDIAAALECLALEREDVEQLRTLSPNFDKACRNLAADRLGRLEQHMTTRLTEGIEWAHSAASALRLVESKVCLCACA